MHQGTACMGLLSALLPFHGVATLHCTAGKSRFCHPEGEQELGRGREAARMKVPMWDSLPEP